MSESDDEPRHVPLDAAGDLSMGALIDILGGNVEVETNPTSLAPTRGRVVEDATDGTIWLGDGTTWLDVEKEVGFTTPKANTGTFNGVEQITEAADLPDPVNGYHQLEAKPYVFRGIVTSTAGLELHPDTSPVLGGHASRDGFIHTGGQTAIKSDGAPVMMRNVYAHAPGGTLYDFTADNTTEMLIQSCGFSDAANIAPMASLGTVTGFRVPTWKTCNFEDFGSGLTFDGDPDKIFMTDTPLRTVTDTGVSIFTLAGSSSVQIVDFADNYIKNVQPDTEVWRVEAGGEPSEVFQYRGTTHDTTVTKENILAGPNADVSTEPFWVSDAYPLRNSSVIGEVSLNSETTTTISTLDEWYEVQGATSEGNETQRTSGDGQGGVTYNGSKDTNAHISISISWYGANGDTYEFALAKNGTPEPTSAMPAAGGGQNANKVTSVSGIEDLVTGDTISLVVRNRDGTNDLTTTRYNINFLGT